MPPAISPHNPVLCTYTEPTHSCFLAGKHSLQAWSFPGQTAKHTPTLCWITVSGPLSNPEIQPQNLFSSFF